MLFFATVVLIVLKLTGVLSISWLVAFSPILVGLALLFVLFVLSFLGLGALSLALSRFVR